MKFTNKMSCCNAGQSHQETEGTEGDLTRSRLIQGAGAGVEAKNIIDESSRLDD